MICESRAPVQTKEEKLDNDENYRLRVKIFWTKASVDPKCQSHLYACAMHKVETEYLKICKFAMGSFYVCIQNF